MRRLIAIAATFAALACSAPAPELVTERIAGLSVTHPASWSAVSGPSALLGGGLIPIFYLSNAPLNVESCPEQTNQSFDGCAPPIESLPEGGVLVTVSNAGNLNEPLPPIVTAGGPTDDWPGPCRSIGGDRQVYSVLHGVTLSACLRGPGVDANEAAVRAMIASMSRPE